MEKITDYLVPLLLLGGCAIALRKKENAYDLLLQGGQDGLKLVLSLVPTLVLLLSLTITTQPGKAKSMRASPPGYSVSGTSIFSSSRNLSAVRD